MGTSEISNYVWLWKESEDERQGGKDICLLDLSFITMLENWCSEWFKTRTWSQNAWAQILSSQNLAQDLRAHK